LKFKLKMKTQKILNVKTFQATNPLAPSIVTRRRRLENPKKLSGNESAGIQNAQAQATVGAQDAEEKAQQHNIDMKALVCGRIRKDMNDLKATFKLTLERAQNGALDAVRSGQMVFENYRFTTSKLL
jgi:hypothetical protein